MTDKELLEYINEIRDKLDIITSSIDKDLSQQSTIKEIVTNYFDCSDERFNSKSRERDIVKPRYLFYLFGRALLNISLSRLGVNSGNKDHATVLYGINTVCDLLKSGDREITPDYEHLLLILAGRGYDIDRIKTYVRNHNQR